MGTFFDPIVIGGGLGGVRVSIADAYRIAFAGQHVRDAELLDVNGLLGLVGA